MLRGRAWEHKVLVRPRGNPRTPEIGLTNLLKRRQKGICQSFWDDFFRQFCILILYYQRSRISRCVTLKHVYKRGATRIWHLLQYKLSYSFFKENSTCASRALIDHFFQMTVFNLKKASAHLVTAIWHIAFTIKQNFADNNIIKSLWQLV